EVQVRPGGVAAVADGPDDLTGMHALALGDVVLVVVPVLEQVAVVGLDPDPHAVPGRRAGGDHGPGGGRVDRAGLRGTEGGAGGGGVDGAALGGAEVGGVVEGAPAGAEAGGDRAVGGGVPAADGREPERPEGRVPGVVTDLVLGDAHLLGGVPGHLPELLGA